MTNILIIGLGEIGTAVKRIEEEAGNTVFGVDTKGSDEITTDIEIMHVCIPALPDFVEVVVNYTKQYTPKLVIIHSTIPVGYTDAVAEKVTACVVHSPVRGIHPYLYEGIKTFDKYVGGNPDAVDYAVNHLESLRIKAIASGSASTTELLKLLDTTYYLHNIWYANEVKKVCDKHGVNYDIVYTHANKSYNDGYTKLGMPHVVRPVLKPMTSNGAGGHCIIENAIILYESGDTFTLPLLNIGKLSADTYKHRPWLWCEYIGKDKSTRQIAKECGVSQPTIRKYLEKFNIPKKPDVKWDESEILLLEELSSEMTFKEISDSGLLNRTYIAIRLKATELKISSVYDPSVMDDKTKIQISSTLQGIDVKDFQGFVLTENDHIRKSLAYLEWRHKVFDKHGWKCVLSGLGGNLNAHHIVAFAKDETLRLDVDNGVSLRKEIHDLFHELYGNDVGEDEFEEFKTRDELKKLVEEMKV